jgi:GMP synthase (glutamine-hydrolysing)
VRVHFVIHESFEAPGAFETWVRDRGHMASHSRMYLGDHLPESAEGIDFLVVLGGPQSPSTTRAECPYFDAAAEEALISKCITARRAVVGVCLGSQLIGEALGASFEHSPEKEIGKFPIIMTSDGRASTKFEHFGKTLDVGHWHNDMPGLTRGAKVMAYSEGCPRQIVEYGPLVHGFQCHMEFNHEVIELLIKHSEQELAALARHRFVQQPEALRMNNYAEMNAKLFTFLDKLEEEYGKG